MFIKLYETYNKVKKVFVKPKLCFKFCKWSESPCLPVWRRGLRIWLTKDICYYGNKNNHKAYKPENKIIKVGITTWKCGNKELTSDKYEWTNHKLPKGYVWNRDIRKKLKRLHLSWIKPMYQLPTWFSFHITNLDLVWKTKYDDYRFEFPPQLSIVIFDLSFNWWLVSPKDKFGKYTPDHYWESILWYINTKDIIKTDKKIGLWKDYNTKEIFHALDLNYLKEPYKTIIKNVRESKELAKISPEKRFKRILQNINY